MADWDSVHRELDLSLTKLRECFQLAFEAKNSATKASDLALEAEEIASNLAGQAARLRRKSLLFDKSEFNGFGVI